MSRYNGVRNNMVHPFARHLNKFAYRHGTSIELLRCVGAIYLRDMLVSIQQRRAGSVSKVRLNIVNGSPNSRFT